MEAHFLGRGADRIAKHMKADRDKNFMAQERTRVSPSTAGHHRHAGSPASSNEAGY
jgi:hypothetical protein